MGVIQNRLLFTQYVAGFFGSLGKFLIALIIDNMSLGISLALHSAGAKNTRSCSPGCWGMWRESKI